MDSRVLLNNKLRAAAVHFVASAVVVGLAATLVFGLWYPGHYASMMDGSVLFLMVLAVELTLGPLMSLVIFNPHKPRAELFRDYSLVVAVQLAALIYGLYAVALSRPVYEVLVQDRLQVVVATELLSEDLAAGGEFSVLPWFGPLSVCTERPQSRAEREELLFAAVSGRDIHRQPRYYRACNPDEKLRAGYSAAQLEAITPLKLEQLPAEIRAEEFVWMPVVTRFGAWIVVFSNSHKYEPVYLDLFPFTE